MALVSKRTGSLTVRLEMQLKPRIAMAAPVTPGLGGPPIVNRVQGAPYGDVSAVGTFVKSLFFLWHPLSLNLWVVESVVATP